MSQLEKEVAQYILGMDFETVIRDSHIAYLARQGYSQTMSAFLHECTHLPSNTSMMVLPEASLSTIIADHKARKESNLLLNKIGPQASWDALWDKLQHYLSQLRLLSDSLLQSHQNQPITKRPMERKRQCRRTSQLQQQYNTVSSVANNLSPQIPVSSVASHSPCLPQPSTSPRKRKNPVKSQPLSDASASLDPQQLLDILLEDESLQQHLAHLINSSLLDDGTSSGELTQCALDDILTMAIPETSQQSQVHDDCRTQIERCSHSNVIEADHSHSESHYTPPHNNN